MKLQNKLRQKFQKIVIVVSESGISKKDDIDFLKSTKTKAILVGEHLMASKDIKESLKQLKEWCSFES